MIVPADNLKYEQLHRFAGRDAAKKPLFWRYPHRSDKKGPLMRTAFRFAATIILTVLGSTGAFALQNQDLITKSGLEQQLNELHQGIASISDLLKQRGVPIDDKFNKAWAEAVPNAYHIDKTLAVVDGGLEKLLTKDDKTFLLDHYSSPLGQHITELEIAASKADTQAEIQANAEKLTADADKSSDRIALYQDIDKASGATELAVEMTMNFSLAMTIGMTSSMEGPKDIDIEAFRGELDRQRLAINQQLSSQTLAVLAYAYRDLKTEDLNSYLTFLRSPAARKFNLGVGKLISESLAAQSHDLGRLFGQILARKGI